MEVCLRNDLLIKRMLSRVYALKFAGVIKFTLISFVVDNVDLWWLNRYFTFEFLILAKEVSNV